MRVERLSSSWAARSQSAVLGDLHDTVTHDLTAIVVHADAARARSSRWPDTPGDYDAVLGTIATIGREALTDLRRLLAELDPGTDADVTSQAAGPAAIGRSPGLVDLPALLDRATPADRRIRLTVRGCPRPLPPAVEEVLYRVVQQAVTNALEHARTLVEVTVRYGVRSVDVVIDNDLADRSSQPSSVSRPGGQGVARMLARVVGCGGRFTAGPGPDGRYRVQARVWLPDHP